MSNTIFKKIEITLQPYRQEHDIRFDRITSFYLEKNYGADYDGNRGFDEWFVDDDDFENAEIMLFYKWVKVDSLKEKNRNLIYDLIQNWMSDNSPE